MHRALDPAGQARVLGLLAGSGADALWPGWYRARLRLVANEANGILRFEAAINTPIKLSVIIPCYNAETTLAVQLEALARQRWSEPWEVLVVDNR